MFATIFSFEVKRSLKSPATYIYFLILFLVSFFMSLIIGGAFKEAVVNMAGEKIYANSPIVIDAFFSSISAWVGAIIVVALIGNAVLKDFKYNMHNLIFTTPVSKSDYLLGRFTSAVLVCMLVMTGPALGMMLAYATPWVNPDKIEAFMLAPYLHTYWQTVLPNVILQGAIFFAVSLIARDIFVIWLSLIIFYVAVGVSNSLFSSLQYETISALADPLGGHAKRAISKYWTTYDKNHLLYTMTGIFLWNRLLWLGLSVLIFFIGYKSFSFTSAPRRVSFRKPKAEIAGNINFAKLSFDKIVFPKVAQSFTNSSNLKNLWALSFNECRTLLRNVYFRVILLFGMLLLFLASFQMGKLYETTVLPVTYRIVEDLGGTFQLFVVILTIFFGGEIVWRNRESRIDNILDSLPVPNWVFYVSKLAGLMFMQLILVAIIMFAGIIIQLFKGYAHFEIMLYIKYLFGMRMLDIWLLAVLCIFVHTLVRNKYIGYFIVALFYIWNTFFASLVLKRNLLIFGSDPGVTYSDMNGFGHAIFPYFIFKIYWWAFALVLAVVSSLLWARGTDNKWSWRLSQAGSRGKKRAFATLVVAAMVFIGCGSFIYYNTNVENKFMTSFDQEEQQAKYERTYKKFERSPQPKIDNVKLQVDIYPYTRSMHATGTFVLQNRTGIPIDSIHVLLPQEVDVKSMSFNQNAQLMLNDTTLNYRIYRLDKPLLIGDSITLSFEVNKINHGFQHDFSGLGTPLYNGTFVNNESFLPHIGYTRQTEITDNIVRKKHGLAYRQTENSIYDSAAYNTNVFTFDADFINFDAVVSTVPDQIAVAPGYLQKEWTENGRRYFHYKMDTKILNFYSFLSAKYIVKKEDYKGVSLEMFYTPGHEYNIDRMFLSMKKSLDYYTANFSPFQYRQLRILEFPRYATFAQSFPNTIPFSEGIGFIADVDTADKATIDYPFYVTAHETAHQWFAHQVIGADVEGSNLLSETLAQYGAITVMEKQYGIERIAKFLHIEMDKYQTARSNESEKEKPLAFTDAGQGYVLYQKGGIVMTGLRRFIGEDSVNHALRNFIKRYAFQGAPYPTSLDLVACLRACTPDSLQYMITDGFQKIVVYDNKITDAKMVKNGDGYTVNVTLDIKKLNADGTGKETAVACNDYMEFAVYKDKNTILQSIRYKLKDGVNQISIPVGVKPYKVMLDPHFMLIDKNGDDNEMRLETEEKVTKK